MKSKHQNGDLITLAEAALLADRSERMIRMYVYRGTLERVWIDGGKARFRRADIVALPRKYKVRGRKNIYR